MRYSHRAPHAYRKRLALLTAVLAAPWLLAGSPATALSTFTYNNGSAPPNPGNIIDGLVSTTDGDVVFVLNAGCLSTVWPCASPGAPTTVAIVPGAGLPWVVVHQTSHVDMSGGDVYGLFLAANDSASITMTGGNVHGIVEALDFSQISFLGGYVDNQIRAMNNAHITIAGGTIGHGYTSQIRTFNSGSVIEIHGYDFAIDGVPVGYGDITAVAGTLTGTLSSGDLLDNQFERNGLGTIRLVMNPEPGTGLLLGGGLIALACRARRRRSIG